MSKRYTEGGFWDASTNEETLENSWAFWEKIVCNPDGSLNEEQVRKELHDFWLVMQRVPKVYDHVTGGRICKILTDPQHVIDAAEDMYGTLYNGNLG